MHGMSVFTPSYSYLCTAGNGENWTDGGWCWSSDTPSLSRTAIRMKRADERCEYGQPVS